MRSLRRAGAQGGFTLIEVLVVVAILAVLTAVLFPTVTDAISEADPVQTQTLLSNLQTGTERFQIDVRRTPGEIAHLSNPIGSDDANVRGVPYPDPGKWSGRYIDASLRATLARDAGTEIESGFGSRLCNALFPVNSASTTNWAPDGVRGDGAGCEAFATTVNSPDYAAVAADSMEWTDWELIDDEVDGGDGADQGRVRWGDTDDENPGTVRRMILLVATMMPREKRTEDDEEEDTEGGL